MQLPKQKKVSKYRCTVYDKSAARLLDRDCVNKRGLDLSKEVLWVSVDQGTAQLQVVKVRGKKNSAHRTCSNPRRANWQNFLLTSNFDSQQPWCPLTHRDPQYLFRKM